MKQLTIFLVIYCIVASSTKDPENQSTEEVETVRKPYQYKYTVKDEEKQLFFEKAESGDEQGKVSGKFTILLADGRLLTVEYVADKDDGFVPKISFKEHADPFSKESDDSVK